MKKLFLIIAMALCFNAYSTETTIKVGVDTLNFELVDDSLEQKAAEKYLALLQDSAFRAKTFEVLDKAIETKPEAGSGLAEWITYVLSLLTLLGAIVAKIPTNNALKWLQPIQELLRFLAKHILTPENKAKNGGTHK